MLENDTYKFVSYHGCCSKVPCPLMDEVHVYYLNAFKAPREYDELVCPLENSL